MKLIFILFALVIDTVPNASSPDGTNFLHNYVTHRDSRKLPRTVHSYTRNLEHLQDLKAFKHGRKKRANTPNTAGLEKDTDDPDGVFRTLDELKAMRPGPGVQWRDEMPGMGKENDGDLKRKRRSQEQSTKEQIQITKMLPSWYYGLKSGGTVDKHELDRKLVKLNENVKTAKGLAKNSPNAESQSMTGKLRLQNIQALSHQTGNITRKVQLERSIKSSDFRGHKHARRDTDQEDTRALNTEQDGTIIQHRNIRAADSSEDTKDSAASPDLDHWWLKRLNYVDAGSRPKERSQLKETTNTSTDNLGSESEESRAAVSQSSQMSEYNLSPAVTKQLANRLQQTLQSEHTRESASDKQQFSEAAASDNKEDDWLKNELMLIEIESRALKRKAAQLHNKLRRSHFKWRQGDSENAAQDKQGVTETYSRLHRRVENERMAPWLKREHTKYITEHKTDQTYNPPDNVGGPADVLDLVSRLERNLAELKSRLITRSDREKYSGRKHYKSGYYRDKNENTDFASDQSAGRYKRDVKDNKSINYKVYMPINSYSDYRSDLQAQSNPILNYICRNPSQCRQLTYKHAGSNGQSKPFWFIPSFSRYIQQKQKHTSLQNGDNRIIVTTTKPLTSSQVKELPNVVEQIRRNNSISFSDLLIKVIRMLNKWEKISGYWMLPLLENELFIAPSFYSKSSNLRQSNVFPSIKHAWLADRLFYLTNSRRRRDSGMKPFKRDPVTAEEISMKEDLDELLKKFPMSESEKRINAKLRQADSKSTDLGSFIMDRNKEDDNFALEFEGAIESLSSSSRLRRQVPLSDGPVQFKRSLVGDHQSRYSGKSLGSKGMKSAFRLTTSTRARKHEEHNRQQIGAKTLLMNKNVNDVLKDTLDVNKYNILNNSDVNFDETNKISDLSKQMVDRSSEHVKRATDNKTERNSQIGNDKGYMKTANSSSQITYLFVLKYNHTTAPLTTTVPNSYKEKYLKPEALYNTVLRSPGPMSTEGDTISDKDRGMQQKSRAHLTSNIDIEVKPRRDVSGYHNKKETYHTNMSDLLKLLNHNNGTDMNRGTIDSSIHNALSGNLNHRINSQVNRSQGTGEEQTLLVDYFDDNTNLDETSQSDRSDREELTTESDTADDEDTNVSETREDTKTSHGMKLEVKGHKIEPADEFAFIEKDDAAKPTEYKYSWAEWSECSVSCGIGQRFRTNRCENNEPCAGDTASSETEICSVKDDC